MRKVFERRVVRVEKWYERLLLVLPSAFREEHGTEMVDAFRDQSFNEFEGGGFGRVRRYWARAFFQLLACGLSERLFSIGRSALLLPRRRTGIGVQADQFAHDVHFALRTLRRRPLFIVVAVATLALGIGATTTMFSVVDHVLLRRLPYHEPDRLVNVWITNTEWRGHEFLGPFWNTIALSYAEYHDWRTGNTLYEDVAIYGDEHVTLFGTEETERVHVGLASASLFEVLRIRPALGRTFLPGEDGPSAAQVAILSNELWRTRFGSDPDVLGQQVTLDDIQYSVVGVLPPNFRWRSMGYPDGSDSGVRDVWIPIGQPGTRLGRGNRSFEAIGRLAPDVSFDAALAEASVLLRGDAGPPSLGARMVPRKDAEVGRLRLPLLILLGAAAVLLLIACGNVANLLMGESEGRRLEIATRGALGAVRSRILRQLLTEGLILGLLGAVCGAVCAILCTKLLVALAPPIVGIESVSVNARALVFSVAAGIITAIVFSLVPSLKNSRAADGGKLSAWSSGASDGRVFQRCVVAAEIALTTLLLVAAGLLTRSFASLVAVDPGFNAENVASIRVTLPESRYASTADVAAFYRVIRERIEAIPEVSLASGTEEVPLGGELRVHTFQIEGREPVSDENQPLGRRTVVLPGFHETMGIPLLVGRTVSELDGAEAEPVMVVSESMARRYWPNESAVGAAVSYDLRRTIVGVVGDVHQASLDADVEPTFYIPHAQSPSNQMNLVAKTDRDPQGTTTLMRDAVRSMDAQVPITRSSTMSAFVSQSANEQRYRMVLMLAFALSSALLAIAGVFGVTARAVASRSREMGIRLALGARQSRLVSTAVRSGLINGILGIAVGLLGAVWVAHLLSRFLFNIESTDLVTYAAVVALLVSLTLIGSYVPARRIARIDPAEVLRSE